MHTSSRSSGPSPSTATSLHLLLATACSQSANGSGAAAEVLVDAQPAVETTDTKDVAADAQSDSQTFPPWELFDNEETPCQFPGDWGCPCQSGKDCISDICVETDTDNICTRTCSASCPDGWFCGATPASASSGGGIIYACFPATRVLCKPCDAHTDCSGSAGTQPNLCIPFTTSSAVGTELSGSFCGLACASDAECKDGFGCESVTVVGADGVTPVTAQQCIPKPDQQGVRSCGCAESWFYEETSTHCYRSNQYGKCVSARICVSSSPASGLSLCTALWPEPELCDGVDNDCDGETDEEGAGGCTYYLEDNDGDFFGAGLESCLCGDPGIGFTKNGGDCNDWDASVKPSAAETCDQIDNDCYGKTDELGGC